ncbi:YjbH domain-containing protein [Spongiibacter sp. KMU-158]|uniref:YjbH domain-containing protein n=1 Tax=Spongiibacter pelagi TaxID=2760804 RepID=A0A927GVX6_9GAMM|nr:YjbH domain-containing protein [Spongiibacter pelagi]MBD2857839.1 YjbH domain-containing protein [Spongiibacter pelagi]
MRTVFYCGGLLLCGLLSFSLNTAADEFSYPALKYSQSDFGGVGLLQMPSARMMDDGEFSVGITNNEDYLNYTVSLQLFPWFETTIRYTQVHDLKYSSDPSFSGNNSYTDKSIDGKFRLLNETRWLPQVSLGFRDIGGTGLFDGEYLVGSKQFGPLDLSLGLGWGYLGNRNNLGDTRATPDCGRDSTYGGQGGQIDSGRMFSGCKAIFGGLEYQTPFRALVFKLEYDGNDYRSDFPVRSGASPMEVDSNWNFGAVYNLSNSTRLRVGYERGNTVSLGFTMATNLAQLRPNWRDEKKPDYKPAEPRAELTPEEWQALAMNLDKNAGYADASIYREEQSIIIEARQRKYRDRKEAEERAALLLQNSGIDVDSYRIIETSNGQPLTETVVDPVAFGRFADRDYYGADLDDARVVMNPQPVAGKLKAKMNDPFYFGLSPKLEQSVGGSETFYFYAIGVRAATSYRFSKHFLASAGLDANILDNYDKFKYTNSPDGTDLKRVRTLIRQYTEPVARLNNLQLTYLDHFGDSFYSQVYAGYLETMFAGAGFELLYRPLAKTWAFGVDANYVKQRNPDSVLGLFSEEVQPDGRVQTGGFTGHATLYWRPEILPMLDGTLLEISAGQFLTEDKGVLVDFSRQFDSGVIVGAFASKTDLSAEEFGEGSFTKGFYISIPFDVMTVKPSTGRATIGWQPLTRDGGQKLGRKYSLYGMTDARSPWYTRAIQD